MRRRIHSLPGAICDPSLGEGKKKKREEEEKKEEGKRKCPVACQKLSSSALIAAVGEYPARAPRAITCRLSPDHRPGRAADLHRPGGGGKRERREKKKGGEEGKKEERVGQT